MRPIVVALLLAGAAPAAAQTFPADRVRADVTFLADDLLQGRDTAGKEATDGDR